MKTQPRLEPVDGKWHNSHGPASGVGRGRSSRENSSSAERV
ncbi:MAG TPA: hypothetical protein VFT48_05495 [Pyrinomonadaceae bacterium]|nr:hypothetical protein [Pyrinomonadaceae bacterium]